MKKIILLLSMVFSSTVYGELEYELAQAHCKSAETIAYGVQTYRQLGMLPSEVTDKYLSSIASANVPDKNINEMNKKMVFLIVKDAFEIPIYSEKDYQKSVIKAFSEKHYLACIDSFQRKIGSL